jgi:hypothetical protein
LKIEILADADPDAVARKTAPLPKRLGGIE